MCVCVCVGEKKEIVLQRMEIPTIALPKKKKRDHIFLLNKKAWHLSGRKTWRNSWTSENISWHKEIQVPKNSSFKLRKMTTLRVLSHF